MLDFNSLFDDDFSFDGGDRKIDQQDINNWDMNRDGKITIADAPQHGTREARAWWEKVFEPYCASQITPEMKAQYGDRVVGAFEGKPLVPGSSGEGEGDFDIMVARLQVKQGFDVDAAERIATSVKNKLYGG